MKALIVDDSRAIRSILSHMLGDLGFEVSQARHGREALLYLQAHADTDLALIDWNMPEMNGLELVQAVHADPSLAKVRMMMVTTEVEMSQMTRALEAGAHEYVMKPFTKETITDKLQLLGLSQASEAFA
jgi:two-component system, chemotaxis family, chemotaxis protein CheY